MTLTAPLSPSSGGAADPDQEGALVVLLRRASHIIDGMWHQALTDEGDYPAVQLAEASQGVHRALIALSALERAAPGPSSS